MAPALKFIVLLSVISFAQSNVISSTKATPPGTFELLILHNNDMHARFEQTSQLSGVCNTEDREAGKCYGGFPRVATVVKEAREKAKTGEGPPVLYLNAGDTYTGTAWFTIYKWKIAAECLNALNPDAVSLGNHEFDEGVNGLIPFLQNVTFPNLAANLILNKEPELLMEKNLLKSVIIKIDNVDIGIIGYLTPDTRFLAIKNNVDYVDEIVAIREEAAKLKQRGVNILIALGHSGFTKDEDIAREVEDIDLVIGGHTNTFLWNGDIPDIEKPEGPYPKLIKQKSGRIVPAMQAYAYTKYLGKLYLTFDSSGELLNHSGNPILLNNSVPEDLEMLQIVDKYREGVMNISEEIIGYSLVNLDARSCRLEECNIGNLIADAMVNLYALFYNETRWTDAPIAIIQGGGIRTSVAHNNMHFNITKGELLAVLPFGGKLVKMKMKGQVLKQMLEHSVAYYNPNRASGQFLQFSGIKVTYDLKKKPGSRVVNALIRCSDCEIPRYEILDKNKEYNILMSNFIAQGGDGYTMFEELPVTNLDYNDLDCAIQYIKMYSPIHPEIENRIILLNSGNISFLSLSVIFISLLQVLF